MGQAQWTEAHPPGAFSHSPPGPAGLMIIFRAPGAAFLMPSPRAEQEAANGLSRDDTLVRCASLGPAAHSTRGCVMDFLKSSAGEDISWKVEASTALPAPAPTPGVWGLSLGPAGASLQLWRLEAGRVGQCLHRMVPFPQPQPARGLPMRVLLPFVWVPCPVSLFLPQWFSNPRVLRSPHSTC